MMQVQGIIDSSLRLKTVSLPPFTATQMLIKVHAAGVNRADYLQAIGKYPLPVNASPLSLEKKAIITSEIKENLLIHLAAGNMKPFIDQVFSLVNTKEALNRLKESKHHGKIILINDDVI